MIFERKLYTREGFVSLCRGKLVWIRGQRDLMSNVAGNNVGPLVFSTNVNYHRPTADSVTFSQLESSVEGARQ